jgi:hypothetical protein
MDQEVLVFIKSYSRIYRLERYLSLLVSVITLFILLLYFGIQLFGSENKDDNQLITAFVGIGSSGIITVSIGYIYKFMDKALEAAEKFIKNK